LDIGFFTAADKLAVSNVSLTTRAAEARNPQTSEISFAAFAIDACFDGRPYSGDPG
jgi:hypothetical protein